MLRIIPRDGCYLSVAFRQYPDVRIDLPHSSFECIDLLSLSRLRAFNVPIRYAEFHMRCMRYYLTLVRDAFEKLPDFNGG